MAKVATITTFDGLRTWEIDTHGLTISELNLVNFTKKGAKKWKTYLSYSPSKPSQ